MMCWWKTIERWKQNSAFKTAFKLLNTLFLVIKKCTGFTTDVIWMNRKVCSFTSEPTQSNSRRVSSLKDSSVLLTIEWWTSQKWNPSNRQHTACGEDGKYISKHKSPTALSWFASVTLHFLSYTQKLWLNRSHVINNVVKDVINT